MTPETRLCWAILCRSVNRLDGDRSWLVGTTDNPTRRRLFETREAAREYIEERYGYLHARPDLRAEPHGCRMPRAVRVRVTIEVCG